MIEVPKPYRPRYRRMAVGFLLANMLVACSPENNTTPARSTPHQENSATPVFSAESTVHAISPEQATRMQGVTIRDYPGCAKADQLRIVNVPYKNFNDADTMGSLVVRKEIADEVGGIFEEIHKTGFKIERIAPAEDITNKRSNDPAVGIEIDNELMVKNVTSGFNCRTLDGKPDKHGLGRAIDINPLQNPMIEPNPFTSPHAGKYTYSPPAAEGAWDKSPDPQKLLSRRSKVGSQVIDIFKRHGWRWGGDFKTIYDGQHFDKAA